MTIDLHTHTHTRLTALCPGLPGWAGTRKVKPSEWQWHQLGPMQVCTLLQTDNHASTSPLSFFTGWMPFLPPNQQRQSTEGTTIDLHRFYILECCLTVYFGYFCVFSGYQSTTTLVVVIFSDSFLALISLRSIVVMRMTFPETVVKSLSLCISTCVCMCMQWYEQANKCPYWYWLLAGQSHV